LIRSQIEVISKINYEEVFTEIEKPIEAAENYLYNLGFISAEAASFNIRTYFSQFLDTEILGKLQNFISGILSTTGNVFVGSLAVIFMTFFLLYEKGILRKTIINLIPNKYFEVSMSALYKVDQLLSNYLLGLLSQMFSIFIVAAFGLKIAGIEYAITIAIFAALANLIPYLGPILGASFGLLVSLSAELASEDPEYLSILFRVGIVFLIVQLMDNLIFQPLIFSRSVKAHPLEIFLAVFVGASLGQAPGMILAIPAYTIVRVAAIELYLGVRQYRVFK
ncbi:MAG: AI-2E family transporter, partial [Bacteroidota bacterium]